ncbi:MAG: trypsin-like peptidase domain-containing protein [Holosporales bacterium]|nr:trypsin-like peptidase domain-containing protein [Holosporales bacterium]
MKTIQKFLVTAYSLNLFPNFDTFAAESKDMNSLGFYSLGSESHKELSQKQLFNAIRKGVVAIKVNAHVILDKYVNDKMWHGTGFIVDLESGLIVTNAHVAGELAVCSYEVKFGNGRTAEAKLEYIDPCYDFAILSVDKKDIPQYSIALKLSEKPITLNTSVYSMGNSIKNEFSTYNGYVFDTESILWLKPLAEQSFQFSGLTVPGASGSPVFNTDGEVIGVLYGGKFVSGAALPISYVIPVIEAIKSGKQFKRYFPGCIINYTSIQDAINSGSLPEDMAKEYEEYFPNSNNKILYISKKLTAFNEEKNPLKAGDIIWKVEDEVIGPRLKDIDQILHSKQGNPIRMTVYRDGKKKEFEVPVEELSVKKKFKLLSFAGATFFELTDELKINSGKVTNGVFVTDSEIGSPFMEVTGSSSERYSDGIFQITEIDGKRIMDLDDFIRIIPDLFKKKVFKIKFAKLAGDSQEYSVITKYNPEFADATLYLFNSEKKSWNVSLIKNPSQK